MTRTPLLDRFDALPAQVPPGRGSRILAAVSAAVSFTAVVSLWLTKPALAHDAIRALHARFPDLFDRPWTAARVVVTAGSIVLALVAMVVLHECAHLAAGLAAGFRFHTIAIGPIRVDSRLRVSIHLGTLAWSGGWVSMFPARREGLRWRAIFVVAAGPIAAMTVGVAGLLGGAIVGPASAVFVIGCLLNVLDLVPARLGAVTYDGYRLVSLLRDDAWSRRWLATMNTVAAFYRGVAPDELPAADLEALVGIEDESADTAVAHGIAYAALFYANDDNRSARLLETCLRYSGHVPPPFRAVLISDAAVFQARRCNRTDLALAWRDDLPAGSPPWLRTRAEAAVFQAQGQLAAAAAKLDEFERAIAALPMPSEDQRRLAIRQVGRWKAELADGPS